MQFPFKLVDLTHTLHEAIPFWSLDCGFQNQVILDYEDCQSEVKFKVQNLHMACGSGTHMDAPAHCIQGAQTIDTIPLEQLISPCVVIDVTDRAHAHYLLEPQVILDFEAEYGLIQPHDFIMVKTGWEQYWSQPNVYRNNLVFPSVSGATAELLIQRQVRGLGIDTLSPDLPSSGFKVHQLLLSAGKYLVENAANLDQLPVKGSFIFTVPMKIKEGTESPVRLIGLVPLEG